MTKSLNSFFDGGKLAHSVHLDGGAFSYKFESFEDAVKKFNSIKAEVEEHCSTKSHYQMNRKQLSIFNMLATEGWMTAGAVALNKFKVFRVCGNHVEIGFITPDSIFTRNQFDS